MPACVLPGVEVGDDSEGLGGTCTCSVVEDASNVHVTVAVMSSSDRDVIPWQNEQLAALTEALCFSRLSLSKSVLLADPGKFGSSETFS